ncbi:hypothetical protein HDU80_003942, partial [Chytriomyces hyalinus]
AAELELWNLAKGRLVCLICGNRKINAGSPGNPNSLGATKRFLACNKNPHCSKPRLLEFCLGLDHELDSLTLDIFAKAQAVKQLYTDLKSARKTDLGMASKSSGKGAAPKLVQPILSFQSGKAATSTATATPSVQLGSSRNLVQSIETTPAMQRDWSHASASSSSSSQFDPVQPESQLTPKQAQKRARESASPPQAPPSSLTANEHESAVENNEFHRDLGEL